MHGDRIDFISEYCDRWCERCAFTSRCSAYAVQALLLIDRSIRAWTTIATTTADPEATAIAHRLQALLLAVERTFPDARKFVRPGFDEPS